MSSQPEEVKTQQLIKSAANHKESGYDANPADLDIMEDEEVKEEVPMKEDDGFVGFCVGGRGSRRQQLKVSDENYKRIANIFQDSDDEEEGLMSIV